MALKFPQHVGDADALVVELERLVSVAATNRAEAELAEREEPAHFIEAAAQCIALEAYLAAARNLRFAFAEIDSAKRRIAALGQQPSHELRVLN